jgi:hypothetical protein
LKSTPSWQVRTERLRRRHPLWSADDETAASLQSRTTETALVDKPADEDEHGHGHHGHAH